MKTPKPRKMVTVIFDGTEHRTRVLSEVKSLWGGVLYLVKIKGEIVAIDSTDRQVINQ